MRWARGLVFVFAIGAAAGAAAVVRNAARPAAEPPRQPDAEVLVLRRAIAPGEPVADADLRWQAWPAAAIPVNAIARLPGGASPRFQPAPARYPLLAGEPVSEAKLARPGDGGAMAALIASGMRALAVPVKEEAAAGGLIQANDRVDVLWTQGPQGGSGEQPATRTILRGAKVLAIGKGGNARMATLEVTPGQARRIAGARMAGEMALALVPASELAAAADGAADEWDERPAAPVRVMKFGRQPGAESGERGPR